MLIEYFAVLLPYESNIRDLLIFLGALSVACWAIVALTTFMRLVASFRYKSVRIDRVWQRFTPYLAKLRP